MHKSISTHATKRFDVKGYCHIPLNARNIWNLEKLAKNKRHTYQVASRLPVLSNVCCCEYVLLWICICMQIIQLCYASWFVYKLRYYYVLVLTITHARIIFNPLIFRSFLILSFLFYLCFTSFIVPHVYSIAVVYVNTLTSYGRCITSSVVVSPCVITYTPMW